MPGTFGKLCQHKPITQSIQWTMFNTFTHTGRADLYEERLADKHHIWDSKHGEYVTQTYIQYISII